jgi:glycine/D-amino acid oxidase-like deaminating enzyme
MKSSSKVCVVGAGVVGLSVALYLAEEQLRNHPEVVTEIGELQLILEQAENSSPLIHQCHFISSSLLT